MNSKYIEIKDGELLNIMAIARASKTQGSGILITMIGTEKPQIFYFKTIEERDNHYQMILDHLSENDAYLGDYDDWQEQFNQ